MREPKWSPTWNANTILMVALIAIFVLQAFVTFHFKAGNFFNRYLALNSLVFKAGFVWQLVTYQFLHSGLMHVLFNVLGLYFFGRVVEERLGTRHFLVLYFSAGILGGLLQALLGLLLPQYFGNPVVGASAGVCGILAAFCLIEPHATILLFFILPIPARFLLWFSLFIAAFFTLIPMEPGIAHAAHLGGLLVGMAYLHFDWYESEFAFLARIRDWFLLRNPSRSKITVVNFGGKQKPSPQAVTEDFISRDVDPILDKISRHGIQSLTEEERKILDAARQRMGK
ncbi:MAG: rhomboid family intramembrane serine protease [Verrucomicrobiota bacterium]